MVSLRGQYVNLRTPTYATWLVFRSNVSGLVANSRFFICSAGPAQQTVVFSAGYE